jgi:uncharacterized protein (DUF58 family)
VSAALYVGLAVLVGIAAANRPNNLLVWIFGLMIALVLVSGLLSGAVMLRVRVTRLDPRHGRVGEPLLIRYAVSNQSALLPLFSLHVEELPGGAADGLSDVVPGGRSRTGDAWIMHVGPRETVHGEAVIWPSRRGRLRLGRVRAWSSFPLGLIRKSVTSAQEHETLIYPRLLPLKLELLRALSPGGMGGLRLSRRSGTGEDYFGMREYKPGDSMRQIAWRRFASLGEPIIVERTRSSPPRVRVVLNLQRPTEQLRVEPAEPQTGRDLEETAIAIAASLIQLAEHHGFEVGLSVLGLPERPTPLRRGHWHVQKLLGALAGIDLDQPRESSPAPGTADAERAGLVVVSPDRADPSIGVGAESAALRVDADGVLHLTARHLESLLDRSVQQERGAGSDRAMTAAQSDDGPGRPAGRRVGRESMAEPERQGGARAGGERVTIGSPDAPRARAGKDASKRRGAAA